MVWIVSDDVFIEVLEDETPFLADSFDGLSINLTSTKSRHPIAVGANKSDHVTTEPRRITLDGCIGSQAFNKTRDLFEGENNRTLAACDLLTEFWRSRECATVITQAKVFENMQLIAAPIRINTDGRMTFSLDFEEFEFFNISETFDATIGRKIDLGEVGTTDGEPENGPQFTPTPSTPERLDFFINNPGAFDCPFCGNASQTFCIDGCYEAVYQQQGL